MIVYTAGSNFHHRIRTEKEKDHHLVTFGIYKYLRHPAYFGWYVIQYKYISINMDNRPYSPCLLRCYIYMCIL